jgi:hypothetical protein
MYGGQTNPALLDDFFDDLSRKQTAVIQFEAGDDGQITVGKFHISKTGLQIADGVSVEEWQAFGQHIRTMETSIQWIIGDWLAYGERVHGATYQEVAELTGYAYGTLQNLVWVSKQFEISYRYEKLSHTHHQMALSLCDGNVECALQWLERASSEGWAIKKMVDEIKGIPPAPPLESGKLSKFWHDFESFSKKHTLSASRVGDAERRQMADALRKLADDLEKTKK